MINTGSFSNLSHVEVLNYLPSTSVLYPYIQTYYILNSRLVNLGCFLWQSFIMNFWLQDAVGIEQFISENVLNSLVDKRQPFCEDGRPSTNLSTQARAVHFPYIQSLHEHKLWKFTIFCIYHSLGHEYRPVGLESSYCRYMIFKHLCWSSYRDAVIVGRE